MKPERVSGFVITGQLNGHREDCGPCHDFTPPIPKPGASSVPVFRDQRAARRMIARAIKAAEVHAGSLAEETPAVRALFTYAATLHVESLRKRHAAKKSAQ